MKFWSSFVAVVLASFTVSLFGSSSADLDSDRQALLEFASYVPHAPRLNWANSSSICTSWHGVTCNARKNRVVAVQLPGVGLRGSIPENTIAKLDALRILSLHSNGLTGKLPSDVFSLPSLQFLFLQHNNFSGQLPSSSSSFSPRIVALDLSFNSFSGRIPPAFRNLKALTWLYLQNNSFSGAIPDLNLPKLKFLNLSHNSLSGGVPRSIQKFPDSSFAGNSLLCGPPLDPCSANSPSPSPSAGQQKTSTGKKNKFGVFAILSLVIGACAVVFLLVIAFTVLCLRKKEKNGTSASAGGLLKGKASCAGKAENSKSFGSGVQDAEKNKLFFFEGCSYSFDLEDLLKASAEVLGKGSYGTAYKAVLEEGTTVMVKRLKEVAAGKKEFEQQMEVVGKVGGHPNVMPLRAYYYSKDEKLLVYNYMEGGSLFALLHGKF